MNALLSEAALSLGSNLGERRAHLARALRAIEDGLLAGLEVSSLWETAPVEVSDEQPAFLNLCAVGASSLGPEALLARCRALETAAGRENGGHHRPRELDIDLLYHGQRVTDAPELKLPHPGLARRRFVLAPLAELRPAWTHPVSGDSVGDLLARLGGDQAARRLDLPADWWRHE